MKKSTVTKEELENIDRETIEHPGPPGYGLQRYYYLKYEKEKIEVRYYLTEPNPPIAMWIGADRPTYRGFNSIKEFKEFVKSLNDAIKELDELIKVGAVEE